MTPNHANVRARRGSLRHSVPAHLGAIPSADLRTRATLTAHPRRGAVRPRTPLS